MVKDPVRLRTALISAAGVWLCGQDVNVRLFFSRLDNMNVVTFRTTWPPLSPSSSYTCAQHTGCSFLLFLFLVSHILHESLSKRLELQQCLHQEFRRYPKKKTCLSLPSCQSNLTKGRLNQFSSRCLACRTVWWETRSKLISGHETCWCSSITWLALFSSRCLNAPRPTRSVRALLSTDAVQVLSCSSLSPSVRQKGSQWLHSWEAQ